MNNFNVVCINFYYFLSPTYNHNEQKFRQWDVCMTHEFAPAKCRCTDSNCLQTNRCIVLIVSNVFALKLPSMFDIQTGKLLANVSDPNGGKNNSFAMLRVLSKHSFSHTQIHYRP
jgi:hypothetical protein